MSIMETNRVLSMLNLQASRQLRNGQLEAAQRSVDEAIRYFEAACRRLQQEERRNPQETTTELWKSQVQVSALLKMKLGKMQASMGAQKKDDRLVASGKTVIAQSSRTLRGILLQQAAPHHQIKKPARAVEKKSLLNDKKDCSSTDKSAPSYSSSALTTTNHNYKFSSCGSETSSSCSSSFREHHQKAHMESLDAA